MIKLVVTKSNIHDKKGKLWVRPQLRLQGLVYWNLAQVQGI